MFYVAKAFEALGIAFVLLGLILGINSPTLWVELYLSIMGIVMFMIGRGIEKYLARKHRLLDEAVRQS